MKKTIRWLLCLLAVVFAAGCASGDPVGANKTGNQTVSVSDVLAAGMAEADGQAPENAAPADGRDGNAAAFAGADESVDVDLTVMSATMVYSEVYNMMVSPKDYIGKTVKMSGMFSYFRDAGTGSEYFACIISDATACCSQGIEFVLADGAVYPRDYPDPGRTICVIGVFDTYMEGEYMYCTLKDARFA